MDDNSERRPGSIIAKLAAMSFVSPVVAIAWSAVRLLESRRWGRKLIALSVLGNVLFVGVLIIGYYESINPDPNGRIETGELVAPECIQRSQGPLLLCVSPPESELTEHVPNAIYVAFEGLHRARFEFTDESMRVLRETTLCDKYGRPWIDANLEDGTVIISRYTDAEQIDPAVSLMDRDGDGVPDRMVDWVRGEGFERVHDIAWRPLEKSD